jgi:uncharacterized tellurite resistance protein B-like protein
MIDRISGFFSRFIEPGTAQGEAGGTQALRIATAALLFEVMRMDRHFADSEHAAVAAALREQFGIDPAQIDELMELAAEEARQASGYFQFTSLINRHCDAAQKNHIIEQMWRVAMADGHLDAHESHLMRKIADLLHVGHADYVAAKRRAREANEPGAGGN